MTKHTGPLKAAAVPIARADGTACILGVARDVVYAGDLVQAQVDGPATVNVMP